MSSVPSVDPESTTTISGATDWVARRHSVASIVSALFLDRTITLARTTLLQPSGLGEPRLDARGRPAGGRRRRRAEPHMLGAAGATTEGRAGEVIAAPGENVAG